MYLFRFSVSSSVALGSLCRSQNSVFHLIALICRHEVVLRLFIFVRVCSEVPSLLILLTAVSLFLVGLAEVLATDFFSPQRVAILVSLVFCFPIPNFLKSCSYFYYFRLSLGLISHSFSRLSR